MAEALGREHWAQLRAQRPQREDAMAMLAIGSLSERRVFAAMDQAGNLHLLITVEDGPEGELPTDLNGLKVRHRHLQIGQVVDLCAPPSHEQVFTAFSRAILTGVLDQAREPWKAVAATIREWQSTWKPLRLAMEKTVQVGLFGELLALRTLMIPCLGPIAVDQWSGPQSERHDFVSEALHVEVKTTRRSRSEHEISRLDQLHCPAECELLFVSIQLEETIGGNETLATQIDAVVDLLRTDSAALDDFMTKVASVGWSDEMRTSGELARFFVRRVEVYVVDDEFPRLPESIALPSGVVSVRYTIDLANLPQLGIDEAQAMVRTANGSHGS